MLPQITYFPDVSLTAHCVAAILGPHLEPFLNGSAVQQQSICGRYQYQSICEPGSSIFLFGQLALGHVSKKAKCISELAEVGSGPFLFVTYFHVLDLLRHHAEHVFHILDQLRHHAEQVISIMQLVSACCVT